MGFISSVGGVVLDFGILSPNISTIVNFLPNHTDDILDILNNQKNLQIQCLTTKSNSKKGEISGYVSGGDKDSIRIELLDSNNQITYHKGKDSDSCGIG